MTFGNDFMESSEQRCLESDGKGEEVGFAYLLACSCSQPRPVTFYVFYFLFIIQFYTKDVYIFSLENYPGV